MEAHRDHHCSLVASHLEFVLHRRRILGGIPVSAILSATPGLLRSERQSAMIVNLDLLPLEPLAHGSIRWHLKLVATPAIVRLSRVCYTLQQRSAQIEVGLCCRAVDSSMRPGDRHSQARAGRVSCPMQLIRVSQNTRN